MFEPIDIRTCWDDIKPGLQIVKDRTGVSWRLEDVYASCVSGESVLFVVSEGFLIVNEEIDEFTRERGLVVWIAWGQSIPGESLISKYEDDVESLARARGSAYITTYSPRVGLGHKLKSRGWNLVTAVYRRRVGG